ncbi:MAG TPA: hypothetical protein VMR62_07295 [Bryobacteraceae bacterium]|nr:hypothetical protein [Bryobacteraceae bacterium]
MMQISRRAWALLMLTACGVLTGYLPAAQPGGARAFLTGTTVPDFPSKCDVRLDMTGDQELLFVTRQLTLHVPYDKVNTVEYGQHVGRRYAEAVLLSPLFLLSKTRKHFVTVGYVDANGRQQALVLQVGKGDVRAVLAELEAKTGRRVEYMDDEARKGRG